MGVRSPMQTGCWFDEFDDFRRMLLALERNVEPYAPLPGTWQAFCDEVLQPGLSDEGKDVLASINMVPWFSSKELQ